MKIEISQNYHPQQIEMMANAAKEAVQRSEAVKSYLHALWHSKVKAAEIAAPNELALRMAEVRMTAQIYSDLFDERVVSQGRKF